jgi:endonuclease/exonuclease/phosphatase family metal-dependent hydrolase
MPLYHGKAWTAAQYNAKRDWTAGIVKQMDVDVWGFQELWHYDSLKDVFNSAGLLAKYKLLAPQNHKGKIICAGAVRKDWLVGDPEWIEDFPEEFMMESGGDDDQTPAIDVKVKSFSRPVLHFQIKPREDGKKISVYVCHLKSKLPTKIYKEKWYKKATHSKHSEALGSAIATIRRTVESAALRLILTEEMKDNDQPVVVIGDCNDNQHSNTLNILGGQPNYLQGLSKGGGDTDLYTVGTLQEYRSLRDVYYTHIHQNMRESLDHILVSQEFYDNSRRRIWAFKGMELVNDHLNDDDHKTTGTSDHGIVKATFEYNPAKSPSGP